VPPGAARAAGGVLEQQLEQLHGAWEDRVRHSTAGHGRVGEVVVVVVGARSRPDARR
jgi:hypothetical protein